MTFINKESTTKIIFILALASILLQACRKFVETEGPATSSNSDNVYENDATATSVLTGIYIRLSAAGFTAGGELTSLSLLAGLSADELKLTSEEPDFIPYFSNSLLNTSYTPWSSV